MNNEFYWVGIVFNPDHVKSGDDELHGLVHQAISKLEAAGADCYTRSLPKDALINEIDIDGRQVVDVFRGGDGARIGFGWSVDCLQTGMGLMAQAREWLAGHGICCRWISVYLWDTQQTEREPVELIPPIDIE